VTIIFALLQFATSKRVSLKSALSLFQLGEFGLVVFELASAKNLVDASTSQVLIVVIILSMLLTPFLLRHISTVTDFLMPPPPTDIHSLLPRHKEYNNHVILIGYGRLGKHLAKMLERDGYEYVVVEQNIQTVKEARKLGIPIMFGNAAQRHILEALNIHQSLSVVISLGNNEKLYLVCEAIMQIAPEVKTVVKVNSFLEKEMLLELGLTHIIVETEETAMGMYHEALQI
jgi:CPA2 family monovalent cation:H+ antiporter-2